MEYLFIYLLQMAGVIEIVFKASAYILALAVAVNIVLDLAVELEIEGVKTIFKATKKYITSAIIVLIILLFIPTQQTLLLIGGTYIGKKAVNQVVASDKFNKLNTIIELELDKRIKKMKEGNNDRT